jgi:hypothetical protein
MLRSTDLLLSIHYLINIVVKSWDTHCNGATWPRAAHSITESCHLPLAGIWLVARTTRCRLVDCACVCVVWARVCADLLFVISVSERQTDVGYSSLRAVGAHLFMRACCHYAHSVRASVCTHYSWYTHFIHTRHIVFKWYANKTQHIDVRFIPLASRLGEYSEHAWHSQQVHCWNSV